MCLPLRFFFIPHMTPLWAPQREDASISSQSGHDRLYDGKCVIEYYRTIDIRWSILHDLLYDGKHIVTKYY